MKFRMFAVTCSALVAVSLQAQTAFRVTKDNIKELHAKLRPELLAKVEAATTTEPNVVRIGQFYEILWTNGQAMYEFDYYNPKETCPGPDCYYTGPIEFSNAIWYVNGTSFSWASTDQGPINTNQYYGVVGFTDTGGSVSNCNPLTNDGLWRTIDGDKIYAYQSSCIDIAFQLISSGPTNTFNLLDGSSFTAYGTVNTFITPYLGNAAIYTHCDDNDFCSGQTATPVYMYRKP
jgi:hypothetical protein